MKKRELPLLTDGEPTPLADLLLHLPGECPDANDMVLARDEIELHRCGCGVLNVILIDSDRMGLHLCQLICPQDAQAVVNWLNGKLGPGKIEALHAWLSTIESWAFSEPSESVLEQRRTEVHRMREQMHSSHGESLQRPSGPSMPGPGEIIVEVTVIPMHESDEPGDLGTLVRRLRSGGAAGVRRVMRHGLWGRQGTSPDDPNTVH